MGLELRRDSTRAQTVVFSSTAWMENPGKMQKCPLKENKGREEGEQRGREPETMLGGTPGNVSGHQILQRGR